MSKKVEFTITETYHLAGASGFLGDVCSAIVKISKDKNQPLTLCFNGTLVAVSPDMNEKEVYTKWNKDRDEYQLHPNRMHPAMCPECLRKEMALYGL